MPLLPVPHCQQHKPGECLAACAKMALDYLSVPSDYEALVKLLRIEEYGGVFSDLQKLDSLGVAVLVEHGEIETLRSHLENGLPPIALVNTNELSYWDEATGHAVVVVGLEVEMIYLNDPAFPDAPKRISADEFLLAWIDADQFYALVKLE